MKELHVTITGKVQGVWFRSWTRDIARELGLVGWVRNKADGNVEALGQGSEDLLMNFIEQLQEGPPLARVMGIELDWRDAETKLSGFEVRF